MASAETAEPEAERITVWPVLNTPEGRPVIVAVLPLRVIAPAAMLALPTALVFTACIPALDRLVGGVIDVVYVKVVQPVEALQVTLPEKANPASSAVAPDLLMTSEGVLLARCESVSVPAPVAVTTMVSVVVAGRLSETACGVKTGVTVPVSGPLLLMPDTPVIVKEFEAVSTLAIVQTVPDGLVGVLYLLLEPPLAPDNTTFSPCQTDIPTLVTVMVPEEGFVKSALVMAVYFAESG